MVNYKCFSGGRLGSNSYLVYASDGSAMVVDCGNPPERIYSFAKENGLTVKYIILTHGHYDHVDHTEDFAELFSDAVVISHPAEAAVLTDPYANVSVLFGDPKAYRPAEQTVVEGDVIRLGEGDDSVEFTVLSTPGHTPGSICLYCEKEKLMLTGDTLFAGGRGRTDFRFGDEELIWKSLDRLLSMDGEITFLSGHGAPSRIAYERGRIF